MKHLGKYGEVIQTALNLLNDLGYVKGIDVRELFSEGLSYPSILDRSYQRLAGMQGWSTVAGFHVLLLHRILYKVSGAEYNTYTPRNIKSHCEGILASLQASIGKDSKGYVTLSEFKESAVLKSLLISLPTKIGSYLSKELAKEVVTNGSLSFELIHLHNLLMLMLLLDIEIVKSARKEGAVFDDDD